MSTSFFYKHTYTLDKSHFEECFTQSVNQETSIKNYRQAIFFSGLGLFLLLFTQADRYMSWFFIGLSLVDALSVYYRKAWWLTRQMLSKAAGGELTLTIDDEGIKNNSFYVNNQIMWNDIEELTFTELGLLIKHNKGINYLSNRVLSEEARQYVIENSVNAK